MPVPNEQSKQYGQQPFYYVNGLGLSNDATTPNTKLDVAVGTIIDSTATYQMALTTAVVINAAANGFNGLDTGSLAASKVYYVYLIADVVSGQATGAMISLSATPLMPFGYQAFALIGYVATDASSHFLLGYWTAGDSPFRKFIFDAPQATAVTAGAATSYTAVDLTKWVPLVANTPVMMAYAFTPGAASRQLKLQGVLSTGDAAIITGQVTSVVVSGNVEVWAQISAAKPEINYLVSNAGDAVALNVAGYAFAL